MSNYLGSYKDYENRSGGGKGNNNHRGRGRGRGRGGGGGPFKKNNNRYGGGERRGYGGNGVNPRSRFEDDDGDIDMGGSSDKGDSRKRFSPYGRQPRGGGRQHQGKLAMDEERGAGALQRLGLPTKSGGGRGGGSRRGSSSSSSSRYPRYNNNNTPYSHSGWYRVQIPYGKKAGKDFILKNLTETSTVPFIPIQFQFEQQYAVFYVQDKVGADALRICSKKITMPNGFKMMIMVRPSGAPKGAVKMDSDTIEKLKLCMSNRYDPSTKLLNLSNLYNDPDLKKEGLFLAANKRQVMDAILDIIHGNIQELVSLDLNSNRLYGLDNLSSLGAKVPNVLNLNLSKNDIKHINELDTIKKLKLEELFLDGNPLCDRFDDKTSYISAVRKRFPSLLRLDGHVLPPPITFEVEAATTLPPEKGNYFGNETVKQLICLFLDQYYALYDDNRQGLLEAYHDNVVFSLCAVYNKVNESKQPGFNDYFYESRNLIRIPDNARRQKALKTGKLNVVALLNQLPKTQHDPHSFKVDVGHASENFVTFTVHGIFKEVAGKQEHHGAVRAFSRTFITVPQGSGIVIINEEFTITNATHAQLKKSFRSPAPTPSSSPVQDGAVPGPSGVTPTASPAAPPTMQPSNPQEQELFVQKFSEESKMNVSFSRRCLEENNWDYNKSALVFMDLQAQGKIPPDAFVK